MSLTSETVDAVAAFLAGRIAAVRMSGPEGSATTPARATVQNQEVLVAAEFAELEANFEWRRREIIGPSGEVVDVVEGDFGRKPIGAIWTVELAISARIAA